MGNKKKKNFTKRQLCRWISKGWNYKGNEEKS